jgi:hypothetical protein
LLNELQKIKDNFLVHQDLLGYEQEPIPALIQNFRNLQGVLNFFDNFSSIEYRINFLKLWSWRWSNVRKFYVFLSVQFSDEINVLERCQNHGKFSQNLNFRDKLKHYSNIKTLLLFVSNDLRHCQRQKKTNWGLS